MAQDFVGEMGATAHVFKQFLHFVELAQLTVNLRHLKVNLLLGVLFEQGQKAFQVVVEVLDILEKQFLAFKNHLAVFVPHPETHESVEQVFQAYMLVVTVQVVVRPPQETAQVNLVFRLVMALFQEGLVVVDERQFALVVRKADAEKAPDVP